LISNYRLPITDLDVVELSSFVDHSLPILREEAIHYTVH